MRGLAVERYLGLNVVILFSSVDCGVARWPAILAFAAYPVEMIERRFGPSGLLPLGRSASLPASAIGAASREAKSEDHGYAQVFPAP
jgi:hypothetical protein